MKNKFSIFDFPYFKDKKIYDRSIISESFGICCEKITLSDGSSYIAKYYLKKNDDYDAILIEGKIIKDLNSKFDYIFPDIYDLSDNFIIMQFIEHNKIKKNNYQKELANIIAKIHSQKNDAYGYKLDTPIGGLKQPCKFSDNWIDFYKEKRLGMIFELINKKNPMPSNINKGIEKILNHLNNLLPSNPEPSLIHGDLWDGNILINNDKVVGLIDPGIHYAHNEMELAYLNWFNYVDVSFFDVYNDFIKVDQAFYQYQYIYQLYYSLLNVHLWSREYIDNVKDLVKKFE